MELNTLEKIVKENGYELGRDIFNYIITKKDSDNWKIKIRISDQGRMWFFSEDDDGLWFSKDAKLSDLKKFKVIIAAVDFADTPVDKRGLKPLFVAELKDSRVDGAEPKILGFDLSTKETIVREFRWKRNEMYKFTLDEINEMADKYDINLDDFEVKKLFFMNEEVYS